MSQVIHKSYESGILEDPAEGAPPEIYLMTQDPKKAPNVPARLIVEFKSGIPVGVRDAVRVSADTISNPLDIFVFLNKIAGEHGVGRIDIVENRFIGLKSRGIYETPGGTVLYAAHTDLETFCLDREVLRVKNYLRDKMADYVYNGFWFSPECEFVRESIELSQRNVTGTVEVELYKGSVTIVSRSSPVSLYNQSLVSMDQHGGFDPADATGFIRTNSIRLKEYQRVKDGIKYQNN